MNPADLSPAVPAPAAKPEFPLRFVVVTFVLSGLVGAVILYFGLRGQLGAPIP